MLTGENFKRHNWGTGIKDVKAKIQKLKDECHKLQSVNNIREYGFDEYRYTELTRQIEWQEYLLWGLTK